MPDWASELLRYGPLGAFALAVCWGGWILLMRGGEKAYTLGERYVQSTEKLHDTLKESNEQQRKLCEDHATALESLDTSIDASLVVQQESCRHLQSIVETGLIIAASRVDLRQVKAAMIQYSQICRVVSGKEFPDSAVKVAEHCTEIERIFKEA
jgi:hypothetical protein